MDQQYESEDGDKPEEYCGIVGVYLTDRGASASRLAYYGLQSLQHRGQESTGIASANGEKVDHFRKMGLVADVYDRENLSSLEGHIAIGHVLYSTSGKAS